MMNENTRTQIAALEDMRLPDLQARYAEVIGEATRTPNRRFLIRRIAEALEAQSPPVSPDLAPSVPPEGAPYVDTATDAQPLPPTPPVSPLMADTTEQGRAESIPAAATEPVPPSAAEAAPAKVKLSKLTVPELQARYAEVVKRPTQSSNSAYLQWKIRQAEKGKVPVGPRAERRPAAEPQDFKVLPLRMDTEPLCVTSIRRLIKQIWLLLDGL